jgi:hypothetical protein
MGLKSTTTCFGYVQQTSVDTATGLTNIPTRTPGGAKGLPTLAIIVAEAQGVRYRDDGVSPTATVGMPLAVGVPLAYDGDLTVIQFISQVAGAKLNISYYG